MPNDPDLESVFRVSTANRLLAADMFASLTPEQWRTPSLCAGWSVREVAAHLLAPLQPHAIARMLLGLVRYRGDADRVVDAATRKVAGRATDEIVGELRERASTRFTPPVVGALGPLTDTCIHLRDAARPLGSEVNPPPESWRPALDFLVSKPATRGFLPRGRLDGLALIATDQDWRHGSGPEVRGASEAIAMAITGRAVAIADLDGNGVEALRERV